MRPVTTSALLDANDGCRLGLEGGHIKLKRKGHGGHKVNLTKSGIYIPGADHLEESQFSEETRQLFEGEGLKRVKGGMRTMGAAVQGEYESALGPYAMKLEPALARVVAAELCR